ncbi:hypothetical protein, partial [Clostridium sp. CCUG 7971]|uniref:hypothetical protein n=1 Tax=Clostridium sp. CCUG 7971 TaxID=2811414 RepID=UPI00336BEC9B|nr:hypothetical protein [Clostridium sp. CCUG 7971]
TMWYVNVSDIKSNAKGFYSFISTMWYVNQSKFSINAWKNYRFISTMWYVNSPTLFNPSKYEGVLYQLCGM